MTIRVKICCIASHEEAALAVRAGASAIGLVSEMPSGPGVIPEQLIAEIAARVPPGVATFLLTSKTDPEAIIAQQRACRTSVVQLVGRLPLGAHARLRAALPGIALVQVIHVTGSEAVAQAATAAPHIDALLLDSGRPFDPVPVLGGTGRVHDWLVSRAIREAAGIPVFLAGGLRPENVGAAIASVSPYGVDVCSGVRTGGQLDPTKLAAFMDSVLATTSAGAGRR